ncbi:hypothetical protein GCM10011444_16550 [Winogradskyella haliclonae]|uniref:Cytochrome C and Quinol oxidase polypeptide I n=1 Tax=Winogradskyella haliclonae TaxID=2048558 RepID=A0ABQ2BZI8_9FLAO|nr:hypothetical protein GCM10011444_16550 [Winogradskyella haliclonae]
MVSSSFDINIRDTYFVSAHRDVTVILCGFYALIGILYLLIDLAKVKLNTILTRAHMFLTIGAIFVYFIIEFILKKNFQPYESYSKLNSAIVFLTSLVLIAQFLFIINITISTIKNFKNKSYYGS